MKTSVCAQWPDCIHCLSCFKAHHLFNQSPSSPGSCCIRCIITSTKSLLFNLKCNLRAHGSHFVPQWSSQTTCTLLTFKNMMVTLPPVVCCSWWQEALSWLSRRCVRSALTWSTRTTGSCVTSWSMWRSGGRLSSSTCWLATPGPSSSTQTWMWVRNTHRISTVVQKWSVFREILKIKYLFMLWW